MFIASTSAFAGCPNFLVYSASKAFVRAFAEGLSLTAKLGLSQEDLIDVISHGAIATPMYALKGPAMKDAKYPTAFPLKHQQKDVRLALECAAGKNALSRRAMAISSVSGSPSACARALNTSR